MTKQDAPHYIQQNHDNRKGIWEGTFVDNTGIPLHYHCNDSVVIFWYYQHKDGTGGSNNKEKYWGE